MIISFISLLFLTFVIIGYSYIFKLLLNNDRPTQEIAIFNLDFIYGLFLLSLISIIANFFIPLQKITYPILLIGISVFIYIFIKKRIKINLISLVLIIFFLIFISHTQGVGYDTQLYHLQIIKLNTIYKSIFGIANLEGRYGMNSSWHSLISLFNISYKEFKLLYIVNFTVFSFIINEIFSCNSKKNGKSKFFLVISLVFIFVYSYFHPFGNGTILNNLGSPEVDIVASFLFIFGIYLFINFYEEENYNTILVLILSSVLIFTIKINYLAILFLPIWIIINKNFYKTFLSIYLVSFFFGISWLFKSFIATGCLIFPLSITCFKTSWSLSHSYVENFKNIVMSFARDTPERLMFSNFDHTLNSYNWVKPWVKEYFLKTEILYLSFLIISANIVLLLFIYLIKKNINFNKNYFFLLITLFISLIIWLQAPEIRFGYGTIIAIFSITATLLLQNISPIFFNIRFNKALILLPMVFMISKNFNNRNSFTDIFQRSFNYEDWKLIQNTSGIKIYNPPMYVFCAELIDFCTYETNKVFKINKKRYLYFLN